MLYRFIPFLLFVLAILVGVHFYFWLRLVRETQLPPRYRTLAKIALIALASSVPVSLMAPRLLPRSWVAVASWPGYIWLGFLLLLFASLFATDGLRLGFLIWRSVSGRPRLHPVTRLVMARVVAMAIGAGVTVVGSLAIVQGLQPPSIKEVRLEIPRLPPALVGTTIVQLTDLHIGATKSRTFVEDVVRRTNALAPDLIVLTGDVIEGRFGSGGQDASALAGLRSRLGTFMVTGNHEYYSGLHEWLPKLRQLGIRMLRNEQVVLDPEKGGLELAGIDDWNGAKVEPGEGPDLGRALAGHDPRRPLILLSHQPRAIRSAAQAGVDLVLSGHTHGGQIWPFSCLVRLQQPFLQGLHRVGQTQIYISPGTGYWGPPMRLGTRAEITRITLVAAGS